MKTIKIIGLVLAGLFLTVNLTMATTPQKQKIEKEKCEVLNKIRKSLSNTHFTNFVEMGKQESIVVRCSVNENNQVVVNKVIGFDEQLKNAVRKQMERKKLTTSSLLVGEELALRLTFTKLEQ